MAAKILRFHHEAREKLCAGLNLPRVFIRGVKYASRPLTAPGASDCCATSSTAHILGGAVIGSDPTRGVVDPKNRVFGYRNLLVCDGAAMPANPGVNPSLTITAVAEHAMSHVPATAAARG